MKDPGSITCAFSAQQRTVDFSSVFGFKLSRLLSIINLSARTEIYAVADEELGFTSYANGVVALAYDTRTMSDADLLQVFYEDGLAPLPSGAAVANSFTSGAGAIQVRQGPGKLTGFDLVNFASQVRIVSLFDSTATPAVGAVALMQIPLMSGSGRSLVLPLGGIPFTRSLWASVAGRGPSSSPSAGDVVGSLFS